MCVCVYVCIIYNFKIVIIINDIIIIIYSLEF